MRLQLAGTAKKRSGEAANRPRGGDQGASKYPPRATAGSESTGPLPLSLSWAQDGAEWNIHTLLYRQGGKQTPGLFESVLDLDQTLII